MNPVDHNLTLALLHGPHLSAFALAGDHTLTAFDRGFGRYQGLRIEIPL